MAWQAIKWSRDARPETNELDARYLIERLLRGWLKSEGVWCESLHNGVARIRVASAGLQQEVSLREFELKAQLKTELNYQLKVINLRQV